MQEDPKEIDVHKIITTSFNIELNPFIAHFNRNHATFESVNTGGITEIRVLNASPLASYAFFLEDFRDGLYSKTRAFWLLSDEFIQALEPLLKFYVDTIIIVESQQYLATYREELINGVIKPLSRFLRTVDESLDTKFLIDHAEKLKGASPIVNMRVKNFSRYGIPKLEVKVSSVVAPIFGEYSRVIPLFVVSTDSTGLATFQLTQGCYDFEIPRYGKRIRFEAKENSSLEINVQDLGRLFRYFFRIKESEVGQTSYERNMITRASKDLRDKRANEKKRKKVMERQTETNGNKYGHKFVVPKYVYSNPEYREYLDNAQSIKSVKGIVDEYNRKFGKHRNIIE